MLPDYVAHAAEFPRSRQSNQFKVDWFGAVPIHLHQCKQFCEQTYFANSA